MKDLVRILEGLGYRDVRTYIQSGNVVFRSERNCSTSDAEAISQAVAAGFGFLPNVMLLEKSDLLDAAQRNPFPTSEGRFLHFMFMNEEPPAPDLKTLQASKSATEQFRLDGRVFYLYTPDGFGSSRLAERVERCLGVPATARNFNTVRKLLEMAGSFAGQK